MANLFGATGAPAYGANLNLPFNVGAGPAGGSRLNIPGVPFDQVQRNNSYFGLNSFVSVAAHYNTVANPDDSVSAQDCRDLGTGMLVFARETTNLGAKAGRPQPNYRVMEGQNMVELKELTQLNHHLITCPENAYETAEEVIAAWRLMGVVKTEQGPRIDYGSAPVERILNLIVSHRISVLNYWIASSKIVQTQRMYIIVKRDPAHGGRFQLFPFTSATFNYPQIGDLVSPKIGKYEPSMGAYYYVGRSTDQVYAHREFRDTRAQTPPDLSKSLLSRGLMTSIEVSLAV